MKPQISYWYGLKHWMLTLFLAPLLLEVLLKILKPGKIGGVIEYYIVVVLTSVLLSLPALILYVLVFICCVKQRLEPKSIKDVLIVVAVLSVFVTFLILGISQMETALIFGVAYSFTIILTGWLLPIQKKRID